MESKGATENYHAIEWTPRRSLDLLQFYASAPVSMQCQAGGGSQLPGQWTGLLQPMIERKLPPEESDCKVQESNFTLMKKSGRPMNEMRRSFLKRKNADAIKRSFIKRGEDLASGESKRSFIKRKRLPLDDMNILNIIDKREKDEIKRSLSLESKRGLDDRRRRSFVEVKRSGKPMNEMKRSKRLERLMKLLSLRKRAEESPDQEDFDDYELTTKDYSAEWSEYDTWGFDGIMEKKKRGLGSYLS